MVKRKLWNRGARNSTSAGVKGKSCAMNVLPFLVAGFIGLSGMNPARATVQQAHALPVEDTLQIRSFPDSTDQPAVVGRNQNGWFSQTYAPLETMMNTRVAGQVRQRLAVAFLCDEATNAQTKWRSLTIAYLATTLQRRYPRQDQASALHDLLR